MENRKLFHMKKFTEFIARSSKEWFVQLLADDPHFEREQKILLEKLTLARQNQALVVLQVAQKAPQTGFDTLAGFIASKDLTKETILVRPLAANQALQMVALKDIKKVAVQKAAV
ncbi:hypothetical protein [Enterococcus nangangensis]|uniref:hypothetical protein n=1 Tax=Enterococcus nangangensis TaxID=2559926 RepID=UPI0010F7370B|nr:hypothetical protein [Enterococcus nangangensis]